MQADFLILNWLTPAAIAASFGSIVAGVTAFYTSRVTLLNSERKIQIDTVTQERAKWREKIRTLSVQVHTAAVEKQLEKLDEYRLGFALNLNPFDKKDNLILNAILKLKEDKLQKENLDEFSDRVAMLLKHDWDRAKNEAKHSDGFKGERKTWGELKKLRDGQPPCASKI